MNTGLKIVAFIILAAASAHAENKLEEFFGVRIGMSRAELLEQMKKKGFEKFVEADRTDLRLKIVAGTCYGMKNTKGGLKDLSLVVCDGKTTDTITYASFDLFEGKVMSVSVNFNPEQGKQAMSGIIGKFGYPAETSYFSVTYEQEALVKNACANAECNEAKWSADARSLRVVFSGDNVLKGQALRLQLFDRVATEKVTEAIKKHLQEDGKKQASKLGF